MATPGRQRASKRAAATGLTITSLAALLTGCALTVENDFGGFGGKSDRNYTNGLRAQYSVRLDEAPGWTKPWAVPIAEAIDFFAPESPPPGMEHQPALGLAVGQTMYSPEDLTRSDVIRDDRPYGGWLYVGLARSDLFRDKNSSRRCDREITLGFDLGVTGRPSLAGSRNPNGRDLTVHQRGASVLSCGGGASRVRPRSSRACRSRARISASSGATRSARSSRAIAGRGVNLAW